MNLKLNLSFKTKKLKKKVGDPLTWAITSELKLYNGHAIHIKITGEVCNELVAAGQ